MSHPGGVLDDDGDGDGDGDAENFQRGTNKYEVIEMDTSEILAKSYTCKVCSKEFPRASNVRMHMKKHGPEYTGLAALVGSDEASPTATMERPRRYSCPHPTCRSNKEHSDFQPLKTEMSLKNHYRRIHCAKLYTCMKCRKKTFAVQADLRTHEKHCGCDWQCSCGQNFSRKDKWKRHIARSPGHTPVDANENSRPVDAPDIEGRSGNSSQLPSSSFRTRGDLNSGSA